MDLSLTSTIDLLASSFEGVRGFLPALLHPSAEGGGLDAWRLGGLLLAAGLLATFCRRRTPEEAESAGEAPEGGQGARLDAATVLDRLPAAVYIVEASGRIRYANRTFRAMFRAGEGGDCREALDVACGRCDDCPLPEILASGRGRNWERRGRDGRIYDVHAEPLPDGEAVLALVHDVTARRKEEVRMLRQERMAAIGRIVGNVTHDFKNLLAAISGYGRLLHERTTDPSTRRCGERILQASERGMEMIRSLLTFARDKPLRRQPLDLETTLEELALMTRTAHPQLRVRLLLHATSHRVMGEEALLHSALLNLAQNAGEAMPRGGVLTIATETIEFGSDPETDPETGNESRSERSGAAEEAHPAAFLEIRFEDNGPGIPAEHLPKVFDPFFTTKRAAGGTGLGLSSVYSILRQHGGNVRLESEEGSGTRFVLRLPLLPAEERGRRPEKKTAPPAEATEAPPERVVVLEPSLTLRQMLGDMLTVLGYAPVLCTSPAEAEAALAEASPAVAAVLLGDRQETEGGAEAICRKLHRLRPETELLLVMDDRHTALRSDPEAWGIPLRRLGKPCRMDELREALWSAPVPAGLEE